MTQKEIAEKILVESWDEENKEAYYIPTENEKEVLIVYHMDDYFRDCSEEIFTFTFDNSERVDPDNPETTFGEGTYLRACVVNSETLEKLKNFEKLIDNEIRFENYIKYTYNDLKDRIEKYVNYEKQKAIQESGMNDNSPKECWGNFLDQFGWYSKEPTKLELDEYGSYVYNVWEMSVKCKDVGKILLDDKFDYDLKITFSSFKKEEVEHFMKTMELAKIILRSEFITEINNCFDKIEKNPIGYRYPYDEETNAG